MEFTTTEYHGFELVAAVVGHGDPLVLIPGHTMSIDRWVLAGYVDAMAAERRVIAVDPLGHGRSSTTGDVDAYHPDHLLGHVLAVLDELEVERADVWGYSRGAVIANQLARRRTNRVRSLVYGGNVLFDPQPILEQLGMAPDPEQRRAEFDRATENDWSLYWNHFPLPLSDEVKADIESRNDLPSILASGLAGLLHPTPWAGQPPVPTLAYWGSDEIFHQLNVDHAAELDIETGTIVGGHAEAFDPAGAAIELVGEFLARRP